VVDDDNSAVYKEPLLGGPPELLVHTDEGGDGTHEMDLALTQEGVVHDVFLIHEAVRVKPRARDGAGEEIVVDRFLDGPSLDVHHYSILTSTYRWNGRKDEDATQTARCPRLIT